MRFSFKFFFIHPSRRLFATKGGGANQSLRLRQPDASRTAWGDRLNTDPRKTLLNRFLLYLNEGPSESVQKKVEGTNVTLQKLHNLTKGNVLVLQSLSIEQITDMLYAAAKRARVTNPYDMQKLQRAVRLLDIECSLRLNTLDLESILVVLAALMHLTPNRITETKFYRFFLDKNNFERDIKSASKNELLQLVFYLGLEKQSKRVHAELKRCLSRIQADFLNELTVEDICVVCNSTYRTNFRITSEIVLGKIKQTLQENLYVLKDASLFVTLIKTIKSHRCEDSDLLSSISCTIFFNKTERFYNFGAMCHIMSLFADSFYYDEELMRLFSTKCFKELKEADARRKSKHVSESIRIKDINRFLWVLSILYYEDVDEKMIEDIVIPQIQGRIEIGEYRKQPEMLITSILYLWMMNYRAKDLLPYALTHENVNQIGANSVNKCRLDLLLTCIKLEDPSLFSSLGVNPPLKCLHYNNYTSQMNQRPILKKIYKALCEMASELDVEKFEMDFQVPHLNIVGISGYRKDAIKAVNVEVIDEYTSLQNTEEVTAMGFMNLKLRILENSEEALLTIYAADVEETSDAELRKFLTDELKIVL